MDAYTVFLEAIDNGTLSARTAVHILQGYIDGETMQEIVDEEGLWDAVGQ